MPGRGIYDTVKQAIQEVIAPQLQELRGDITGFRGDIGGELTGLRAEMRQIEKRSLGQKTQFTALLPERTVSYTPALSALPFKAQLRAMAWPSGAYVASQTRACQCSSTALHWAPWQPTYLATCRLRCDATCL